MDLLSAKSLYSIHLIFSTHTRKRYTILLQNTRFIGCFSGAIHIINPFPVSGSMLPLTANKSKLLWLVPYLICLMNSMFVKVLIIIKLVLFETSAFLNLDRLLFVNEMLIVAIFMSTSSTPTMHVQHSRLYYRIAT